MKTYNNLLKNRQKLRVSTRKKTIGEKHKVKSIILINKLQEGLLVQKFNTKIQQMTYLS